MNTRHQPSFNSDLKYPFVYANGVEQFCQECCRQYHLRHCSGHKSISYKLCEKHENVRRDKEFCFEDLNFIRSALHGEVNFFSKYDLRTLEKSELFPKSVVVYTHEPCLTAAKKSATADLEKHDEIKIVQDKVIESENVLEPIRQGGNGCHYAFNPAWLLYEFINDKESKDLSEQQSVGQPKHIVEAHSTHDSEAVATTTQPLVDSKPDKRQKRRKSRRRSSRYEFVATLSPPVLIAPPPSPNHVFARSGPSEAPPAPPCLLPPPALKPVTEPDLPTVHDKNVADQKDDLNCSTESSPATDIIVKALFLRNCNGDYRNILGYTVHEMLEMYATGNLDVELAKKKTAARSAELRLARMCSLENCDLHRKLRELYGYGDDGNRKKESVEEDFAAAQKEESSSRKYRGASPKAFDDGCEVPQQQLQHLHKPLAGIDRVGAAVDDNPPDRGTGASEISDQSSTSDTDDIESSLGSQGKKAASIKYPNSAAKAEAKDTSTKAAQHPPIPYITPIVGYGSSTKARRPKNYAVPQSGYDFGSTNTGAAFLATVPLVELICDWPSGLHESGMIDKMPTLSSPGELAEFESLMMNQILNQNLDTEERTAEESYWTNRLNPIS